MKQRLLTGWNFMRVLYLAAGIMMMVQSLADRQWLFSLVGLYFAFMGLFAIGCAAGNCYIPPKQNNIPDTIHETEFEEVKK